MPLSHLHLLVDTSVSGVRVGLLETESRELIWRGGSDEIQGSAACLPDLLKGGLAKLGEQPDAISTVLVGSGPGSFTGIRVGIAFARGVAAGRGIRVRGCSSLGFLAREMADDRGGAVGLFLGATASHGYAAFADPQEAGFRLCAVAAGSVPWPFQSSHADRQSLGQANASLYVCGSWPAMQRHLVEIHAQSSNLPLSIVADRAMDAMARSLTGLTEYLTNTTSGYFEEDMEPLYLRRSSVEEKLAGSSGELGVVTRVGGME